MPTLSKIKDVFRYAGYFPFVRKKPFVILIMLPAIFLWDFLIGQSTFYYSDFSGCWIPYHQFTKRAVMTGQSFLWDPDIMLGYPLFAGSEVGSLYPINWLMYLFIEVPYGISFIIFLHLMFSAIFSYKLSRNLSISKAGSLLAAVSYTFSGSLIAQITSYNITLVACYAPVMFYLILKYSMTAAPRFLLWFGFTLGLQLFVCHSQITFILYVASSFFFVVLTVGRSRRFLFDLLKYAGTSLLAGGIAAAQLLPLYELTNLSGRSGGLKYDILTSFSLSLSHYFSMVFPWMYGNDRAGNYQGEWNFSEMHVYAGIIAIIFAISFFFFRQKKSLTRVHTGLLSVLGLAVILSLGDNAPFIDIYRILQHVPGFYFFRCPARWSIIVMLCTAMFVGLGFDSTITKLSEKNRKALLMPVVFMAAVFLLVGLIELVDASLGHSLTDRIWTASSVIAKPNNFVEAIVTEYLQRVPPGYYLILNCLLLFFLMLAVMRNWLSLKAGRALILIFAVLDVFMIEFPQNPRETGDFFLKQGAIVSQLKQKVGDARVIVFSPQGPPRSDIAHLEWDSATYAGIQIVSGNVPLMLQGYLDFVGYSTSDSFMLDGSFYMGTSTSDALGLAAVKYAVYVRSDIGSKSITYDVGERFFYFPRAYIRNTVRSMKGLDPKLLFTRDGGAGMFGPMLLPEASLHRLTTDNPAALQLLTEEPKQLQPAEIISYENGKVAIRARTSNPGLLVLSDMDYPGWKATINGKPTTIYPAYGIFRSVFLPSPGEYLVNFEFRPFPFYFGSAVSILSLMIFAAFTAYFSRRSDQSDK